MLALWLATAVLAAEPAAPIACGSVAAPPSPSAVVWVLRPGRTLAPWSRLTVVPARELREAVSATDGVARLLQVVGRRRSAKPPRGQWLVAVFDVQPDVLCQPIDPERTGGTTGAARCPRGDHGLQGRDDGCGRLVDRATGRARVSAWRVTWRDAAARGFCLLPAERWVAGE